MFRTRRPHRCTYCTHTASEYHVYGPGGQCRPNRAVPICGTIPCAIRSDKAARNTGKQYYFTVPARPGVVPI